MAVIEIDALSKRFDGMLAVENLSFTVERGTIVGFLGPNGAGKTTTLRMLLGLVSPSRGSATINGRAYRELPKPLHTVGAVLESSGAYPGRTARNHLRIQAMAGGVPRGRVEEVLGLVELADVADRRVGRFSLGMRQRLGLATALLCHPEILILDEPANGLDPEGMRWLRGLLRSFADEGRTVLVSSHILAEVAQTVDSVVILNHGRLVAHSTLAELIADAQPAVLVRTSRVRELEVALATQNATTELVGPDQLRITGIASEEIGMLAAERAIPIFEASTDGADLESAFLRMTATHGRDGGA